MTQQIICKMCGYPNDPDETVCENCNAPLNEVSNAAPSPAFVPTPAPAPTQAANSAYIKTEGISPASTVSMSAADYTPPQSAVNTTHSSPSNDGKYYVLCPESNTKTKVSGPDIHSYFCNGCNHEHEIDDEIWTVETELVAETVAEAPVIAQSTSCAPAPRGDNLSFEDMATHYVIKVEKPGGTLGRYGTYGAQYFQSRGLLTVSGEHCRITYELNNWCIAHISRTNRTVYRDTVLDYNDVTLLEDGKILVLADSVSFLVHID